MYLVREVKMRRKVLEQRSRNINSNDLEIIVTKIIWGIGIPAHIKGYRYLRSAIIMVFKNPELIDSITKRLYPDLAKEYKTTPSRIERGIRHAITTAWNRGPTEKMLEIFSNQKNLKTTNSQFIATISEQIRMELIQDNK